MGVNQGHESTRTAQAIINLALMTGNIGRPGTGANSITGQCNAMGSRLFANATSLLGGRDFLNAEHRAEVAHNLGIPIERVPAQNSLAYDQIIERIADGRIKGLWVIATNPAHSWIGRGGSVEALEHSDGQAEDGSTIQRFNDICANLESLVVQNLYPTPETALDAHMVLPAAGWPINEWT